MNKYFLISHNDYANGLKKALEMIVGKQDHLTAYGLLPGGHPDELIEAVETQITPEDNVIILGDIAGGSVCNAALRLTQLANVRLITGTNLPLAIEIILLAPQTDAACQEIIDNAQAGIKLLALNVSSSAEPDDAFF